ncbi:MAG: hypothetical protein WCH39_25990, partial [Schlesneria sp.]
MKLLLIRTALLTLLIAMSLGFSVLADEGDDASPGPPVVTIVQGEPKPPAGDATHEGKETPVDVPNLGTLRELVQRLLESQVKMIDDAIPVTYIYVLVEELNFIQSVCSDLTPQQRSKIKWAAESSVKQAAKQRAVFARDLERRQPVDFDKAMPVPRKMIRDAVAKAVEETLSKEQTVRFKNEAADRTAQRKEAAILFVVSRLDDCLFLDAEQRHRISDRIASNWKDRWEEWFKLTERPNTFPCRLDECVVPQLNADQESTWQGLLKWDI